MRRFKITFFETPFYLCVLHIYHVTRVATLSVRILEIWYVVRCSLAIHFTKGMGRVPSSARAHVQLCTQRFCISGTAWPIVFKFGEWVVGHELCAFHKSWVGYLCTCARAHRASASQERFGRLCSNLVYWLWVINYVLFTSHGWGASARAHVRTPFPDLGNRWAHCAEISWGG